MSAKPKLFAIATENKSSQQLAKEAVAEYRDRQRVEMLTVAESYHHRSWIPEVTLAFMKAEVVKGVRLTQAMIDSGRLK